MSDYSVDTKSFDKDFCMDIKLTGLQSVRLHVGDM